MRCLAPAGASGAAQCDSSARRVARAHFGCERLRGARLEDGGGVGTGGAHWEMRWFRDEYMTGAASPGERVVSSLTRPDDRRVVVSPDMESD